MRSEETRRTQELIRSVETSLRKELPSSWSAQIRSEPSAASELGGRPKVSIVITTPGGAEVVFAAEVSTFGRGSAIDAATRGSLLRDGLGMPTVLITDFANPALRAACSGAGGVFADTTGWLRLVSDTPPLLITSQGAARSESAPRKARTARLNGPASARVIRRLLEVQMPIGVRELAAEAEVSPGTVAKILPTLAQDGAVERAETGAVELVRRRLLLSRWVADYSFAASNREVRWYLAPRGLDRVLSLISQQDDVTATGSLAMREYLPAGTVPVTPLIIAAFYTADPEIIATRFGLVNAAPGAANVVLARPADETLLSLGPRKGRPGVVPVSQALADLLTLPGRAREEAEQLIDYLATTDPAWRADEETS
ncbi:MAG: hypothetical protein HHJ13_17310 [Phycicoccus sp.]|nr:hypothetical protein [Phycicoccus sp.]